MTEIEVSIWAATSLCRSCQWFGVCAAEISITSPLIELAFPLRTSYRRLPVTVEKINPKDEKM